MGWVECDSSLGPPLSVSFYAMKQRIFLGLAPMFILFARIGLYSIWLFTRLGGEVEVILRENYKCLLAGQAMEESAERMDSALSLALAREHANSLRTIPLFSRKVCGTSWETFHCMEKGN
jgi:hypothetical protein